MIRSYRAKLLSFLLILVVMLQVSFYVATRTVIRDAVVDDAYRDLQRGSELFSQLMSSRAAQLAQSVSVLTDDFGFKEAVAIADRATLRSALLNHAARIDADLALVLDRDQRVIASSSSLQAEQYAVLGQLSPVSGASGPRYSPIVINDKLYQFVMSPIMAPLQIGTAGIGFEIDESMSASLKELTDLEVSFVMLSAQEVKYLSGTLDAPGQQALIANNKPNSGATPAVWRSAEMLSSSVSVAQQPQQIVSVLQVPLAKALQPFAVLDLQLLTLAVSFLGGAVLVALLMARSVSRPVKELANVARTIASGDYNSRVAVQGGEEFADLAAAFTTMQKAIAEREQEIIYHAEHDGLTGLVNRSQVFVQLNQMMTRADSSGQKLLVLIVDIYKFTQINDTLSAETGDEILRAVGEQLAIEVEPHGIAIRLGSDEFLLLQTFTGENEAAAFAEQLLRDFDRPLSAASTELRVELNLGYAIYPEQADTPELLLRRANLALQHARQGRRFICSYQSGWDEDHLRRLQLLTDFKAALHNGEICLYYQPKIDARDCRKLGAEALIRWIHPKFGFVNPEEFVAVIESAGQVALLTRWVLRAAASQLQQLQAQGINLLMSVNLSALDLLEDDLADYLHSLLQEFGLDAASFYLEITESAIMQEAEKSIANLQNLHAMGAKISVDDYGTGYSSLSQIKRLPVSELKIDKVFIQDLERSKDDQQIVKSTIALGHSLGLSVTAEGVETEQVRNWLVSSGCDVLQGYLYSKPLPEKDFNHWVKTFLEVV
ncbi:EAL domain-containing protein [Gilvimarinus sp. DA14]|uniref:EAL domain-containing protein n=1 Tax=Gilvimarinus sp. DA14 TaxID=2956798 RepID=UPI0020B7B45D|nr:EAL domain-containing protein [Gilvimarinus sp. DA14]UTF59189.1 EAL domain-containing protein [Gilvimarinus sp. DA14]